jgi:hypothetical protein
MKGRISADAIFRFDFWQIIAIFNDYFIYSSDRLGDAPDFDR